MTYKLAPQAALCYNTSINIVLPERCVNIPWRDEREVMLPSMNDIIPQKRCTNPDCLQWFPATSEYFHSNGKKGLYPQCKKCKTKKAIAYNHQPEVHQRRQPYMLAYNKTYNRENKESIQAQKHTKYLQPGKREAKQAYNKAYRNHPDNYERIVANESVYQKSPRGKELRRVHGLTRRARKNAVAGTHTAQQIQEQLKRQKHKCYYCSSKFEKTNNRYSYHVEHTFPLSRVVGTDIPANDISYLVLACPYCNASKGDKFPWEFPEGGKLL